MAPTIKNKKVGKRSLQNGKSINGRPAKKARISVDSSDEEDHISDNASSSESSDVSSEDDLDDLDNIVSSDSEDRGAEEDEDDGDEEEDADEDEDGSDVHVENEEDDSKGNEENSSNHHDEQRKLLKERKMQRKSGIQVQHIKSLWEKLRVKNPLVPKNVREKLSNEIWELSKDCISDLVLKHDASRVVQSLVKYSSKERREQIVAALNGKFYALATSAYGKYLLVKLLHYGSRSSRQAILNELHGSLRKLMRHREGAYVVEDLYVLYASHVQKQQLIREFWGSEYAVFRDTHDGLTVEQVCDTSIEKRNIIARNLLGTITASVEKGSAGFQILHAAMRELVKIANGKEISEMIELLNEQFAELVHTPEGADVACTLMAKATAKDRKLLIKSLKPHVETLLKNEYGNIVFITSLLCVDDTVLMFKSFGPSVKDNLHELITDKYARRPWLYILLGLDGKYFSPLVMKDINRYIKMSEETSKKPALQRRYELLNKFAPMFLRCINKHCSEILSENLGCQFISEVLINDELYEQLSEQETDLFKQVLDTIITTFKGDISEEDHPIQRPFSTRLLKGLIQGGKWNNKEKKIETLQKVEGLGADFAARFYDDIVDSSNLLEWITNPNSSFTVVAIYEKLNEQDKGNQFLRDLKKILPEIDASNEDNKGAKLLLKLVN
ncbi:hypothetical protein HG535_0H03410 [Zygotorulaspora mrakii]|uniref:PUM-HD domain-containing protein n=1 Tax=Zygotorulaspora mrakii TaxID=42260 RepID=A0A7H9B9N5_ZYGMR|nr:uncharacterized protein HG535_0H03410 [Zygotorulaspora mrakii]QLG75014.1 hypothetical protein HG535_0H03410 [Zygotorulaspora mrakii]